MNPWMRDLSALALSLSLSQSVCVCVCVICLCVLPHPFKTNFKKTKYAILKINGKKEIRKGKDESGMKARGRIGWGYHSAPKSVL